MSRRSTRRSRQLQRSIRFREERYQEARLKMGITDETRRPIQSEDIAVAPPVPVTPPEHDPSEIGRAPGELPAASPFESEGPTRFRVIWYNRERYEIHEFADAGRLSPWLRDDASEKSGVVWVQMLGLTDPDIVHLVGGMFRIPMLAQEDILSVWSRPKFDEYGNPEDEDEHDKKNAQRDAEIILAIANAVNLKISATALPAEPDNAAGSAAAAAGEEELLGNVPLEDSDHNRPQPSASDNNQCAAGEVADSAGDDDDGDEPRGQQIAIVAGANFVISFHENDDHVFDAVERRIAENARRRRFWNPGFLFYALFDTLVDRMLYLTEEIEDAIGDLEDKIIPAAPDINIDIVYTLKRFVVRLRRLVSPLGKIVSGMRNSNSDLFDDFPAMYFSDINDHVLRVSDRVEHARAILQDLQDYHHTLQERKTNDIIRVLTVMSSIFIPLTFLAGVYGMNFKHMPELEPEYGYPICLGVMFTFALTTFLWFRRKKWI
jgi:magnesium transporter